MAINHTHGDRGDRPSVEGRQARQRVRAWWTRMGGAEGACGARDGRVAEVHGLGRRASKRTRLSGRAAIIERVRAREDWRAMRGAWGGEG